MDKSLKPIIVTEEVIDVIGNNILVRIQNLIPPIWMKEAVKRKDEYLVEVKQQLHDLQ